jgi:hypothetical protein
MPTLEEAANELEMTGRREFSEAADFLRRIELERADAERKLLERIESAFAAENVNGLYRAAFKRAVKIIRKTAAL